MEAIEVTIVGHITTKFKLLIHEQTQARDICQRRTQLIVITYVYIHMIRFTELDTFSYI